jgi:hypothetical protein
MPIVHHYTDKQARKFTFTVLLYALILLVILLIAAVSYSRLPKSDTSTTTTERPKKTICISHSVTQDIVDVISNYDTNNYTVAYNGNCDIYIDRNVADPNDYQKIFSKIYVVAKRYDNTLENVTSEEFLTILNNQTITKTKYSTIWDEKTDNYLRTKFNMGVGQVTTTIDNISNTLHKDAKTIAIIPFEQLTAAYSVVSIDDNDPLSKNFNDIKYPLVDTYWLKSSDKKENEQIIEYLTKQTQFNNYDSTKLTSLILTGSSSIGSGEQNGIITKNNDNLYIVRPLLNTLFNTDILQINNEATFTTNCTQAKLSNFLCGNSKYTDILTRLNTSVVGVNGNHILDYGFDAYTNTLKMYKDKGIKSYGGGNNAAQATTPVIIEKNGNKIAFLGYNFLYPFSYYATKTKPGSANVDATILQRDIQNAKKQADIVIVDMSWGFENKTTLIQYQKDFAALAIQYGANIVLGTNALLPQKLSLQEDNQSVKNDNNQTSLIAYGLGSFMPSNLDILRKNGSLILKVYVYNGKMIGTDVIPLTLDTNNQLQLAGGTVKDKILQSIR